MDKDPDWAKDEISDLRRKAACLDALLDAKYVWVNYEDGFVVHFGFRPEDDGEVVDMVQDFRPMGVVRE